MSELRQRRPIVKKSKRRSQAEQDASERFQSEVFRLDMGRCIGASMFGSDHECSGPLQAHHTIRQQTLRVHVSTLSLTDEELFDWIWNPDVGATVCGDLHDAHTRRLLHAKPFRIPFEWLPQRNVDFATAKEVRHLLEWEHPPLFPDGV